MERGASARFAGSAEAMDTEDYPMADEDSILASTELNGDALPITVDPSKLGLQSSPQFMNEPLPFHSPSKAAAFIRPSAQLDHVYIAPKSPDGMDISFPTPKRRSSPEVRIAPKPRATVLPYASSKTGLVYDSRMRFHAELPSMSLNADDIHPEDPRRIHSIFEEIRQAGLVGPSNASEDEQTEDHCWRIAIRAATRPEILLIHTEEHYDFVESLQGKLETFYTTNITNSRLSDVCGATEVRSRAIGLNLFQPLHL
jgi:histone deacetylase 6